MTKKKLIANQNDAENRYEKCFWLFAVSSKILIWGVFKATSPAATSLWGTRPFEENLKKCKS